MTLELNYEGTEFRVQKTDVGDISVSCSSALAPEFKKLVQRGINLWPDAPAEIKRLADVVTVGQVMQDYQDDVPETKYHFAHQCKCGYITRWSSVYSNKPELVPCSRPDKIHIYWRNEATGEEGINKTECKLQLPYNEVIPVQLT